MKLQLIRDVLKAEYNNFIVSSRSITIIKENDVMNLNAITQSQNLLKKNSLKWSA